MPTPSYHKLIINPQNIEVSEAPSKYSNVFLLTYCLYSEKTVLNLHCSSSVFLNSSMNLNVLGSKLSDTYNQNCPRAIKDAY